MNRSLEASSEVQYRSQNNTVAAGVSQNGATENQGLIRGSDTPRRPLRVLVACEYSARVRNAFRRKGHDAWSCDLLPSDAGPQLHFEGDVLDHLEGRTVFMPGGTKPRLPWDLMIAHPPCTYLTCAAEWAYADPDFERYPGVGYHQKVKPGTLTGAARRQARQAAIDFVLKLWNAPIPRICIENPVGVLTKYLGKPQTIQPHQFGEDASKATCLWTRGLPPLVGTSDFPPRIVNGKRRWGNQTDSGQNRLSPGEDRWKERSLTYAGIAEAFATQWGSASVATQTEMFARPRHDLPHRLPR